MYKVIVADDEPFMLEGWRTMIDWRACGYELCGTATDGEEALALFNSVEPDLVVTDIQMPVMDGLGLIHTLREDLAYTSKIVIVTGYSDFNYAKQAIRYQVDQYVLKPLVPEEIHQILMDMIEPLDKRRNEQKQQNGVMVTDEAYENHLNEYLISEEYDLEQMMNISKEILALIEAENTYSIDIAVSALLEKSEKAEVSLNGYIMSSDISMGSCYVNMEKERVAEKYYVKKIGMRSRVGLPAHCKTCVFDCPSNFPSLN